MGRCSWVKVVFLLWMLTVCGARELKVKEDAPVYNHTLAMTLVQYASAVYMSDLTELFTWTCSRCDGLTKGFEVLELIVDVQHCLQAFVGVAEDLNSMVIAFRGTQERSIQNWIEDLFWKQCDIKYPGMPDAMVHSGFYYAYHNTTMRHGILQAVKRGKSLYGDIPVVVTGHSMGGAMASFCALDLAVNRKAKSVQLMTFGQPRIGNAVFATYFNQHLPNTFRLVHDHDMVPHLPPYYTFFPQKTYHHFATEVWLYNSGFEFLVYPVEKVCDSSGEDPTCSRSVSGNSISDHLRYLGVELQAETSAACRIVMNHPIVSDFGVSDPYGNLVLSRDPTSSTLKLNTDTNSQSISVA